MTSNSACEYPFIVRSHAIPGQHIREYPHATASPDSTLAVCVKQYIPKCNPKPQPGDLTIIAAHGNGFLKELYEPLWEDLLKHCTASDIGIRSIWIADVAPQGASGILNEDKLGNDYSWFDHSRDLLCVINHFRDEMVRPLIGIGHSMGATMLSLLSLLHPRLLHGLVLYEPIMSRTPDEGAGPALARASLGRKDVWSSKEEAMTAAGRSLKRWDPRVIQRWNEHAYRRLPTLLHPQASPEGNNPVTLATSKHQEVMAYMRPEYLGPDGKPDRVMQPDLVGTVNTKQPFYRYEVPISLVMLPYIRPNVLYVFGAWSPVSTPEQRKYKMDRTGVGIGGNGGVKAGAVQEIVLQKQAHTPMLEKPDESAKIIVPWLKSEIARWKGMEARYQENWEDKSLREKQIADQKWMTGLKVKSKI